MKQSNLFTLIFKNNSKSSKQSSTLATLIFTILFLALINIVINVLFSYPSNPKEIPNSLQRYFDYGSSVERKVRRIVGVTNEQSAPILDAGWLVKEQFIDQPTKLEEGDDLMVAIYGMSFAAGLGASINQEVENVTVRVLTAPNATPNWTYAAYRFDREKHESKAAVLTLMTANFSKINGLTGMTAFFDIPLPYTYPRYIIENESLKEITPVISNKEQLRSALYKDKKLWKDFKQQLRDYDDYYDDFLFNANFLDSSSIFRLIRRIYFTQKINDAYHLYNSGNKAEGFSTETQEAKLLLKIVTEFANQCRDDNVIPVIYIVNNFGQGDYLYGLLEPTLQKNNISYVSSHIYNTHSDIRTLSEDGVHFIKPITNQIAKDVVKLIRDHL